VQTRQRCTEPSHLIERSTVMLKAIRHVRSALFTEAHELDFPKDELDFTHFLTILGYLPNSDADRRWWDK
jgi:hypothetical protein